MLDGRDEFAAFNVWYGQVSIGTISIDTMRPDAGAAAGEP